MADEPVFGANGMNVKSELTRLAVGSGVAGQGMRSMNFLA